MQGVPGPPGFSLPCPSGFTPQIVRLPPGHTMLYACVMS